MERRFAIIGHRAPSSGKLNLNDLAGASGRLDVLVRAVNTGLFLSHGIREDSDVTLHLLGGPGPVRRIWFQGSALKGVHPDERALAGQIGKALKEPVPAIGHLVELHHGLWHAGGGVAQTIAEWTKEGVRLYVLDSDAAEYIPDQDEKVGFFLSDDQPFTDEDEVAMEGLERVSLGGSWLQGHACIAILHHILDQGSQAGNPESSD
jgi:tRNA (pseudouridine54-N1)-methyltransferase